MHEHHVRLDTHTWEHLSPEQVLATLVYELYGPVSLLGSHLNRLTNDDEPLTEDDYDTLFEQMQEAVRHLSMTVVSLKRYTQEHPSDQARED